MSTPRVDAPTDFDGTDRTYGRRFVPYVQDPPLTPDEPRSLR